MVHASLGLAVFSGVRPTVGLCSGGSGRGGGGGDGYCAMSTGAIDTRSMKSYYGVFSPVCLGVTRALVGINGRSHAVSSGAPKLTLNRSRHVLSDHDQTLGCVSGHQRRALLPERCGPGSHCFQACGC